MADPGPDGPARAGTERAGEVTKLAPSRCAIAREDALWTAVSGLGDRDTTCAIVGVIVALQVGAVPSLWLAAREPLR